MYLGDFARSSIFDFKFTTRKGSGVPTTLSGTPALRAYKTNSTTETGTGLTLTVDFDSVTGCNHVRVDLSSDTTFYAAGCDFQIVITSGTVDGTSVAGEVVGLFSVESRSPLRPATAGRTLVIDAAGVADANAVKVGPTGAGTAQTARDLGAALPNAIPNATGGLPILSAGGILNYTLATLSTNAILSIWNQLVSDVGILTGSFAKLLKDCLTGDIFARLGDPGVGNSIVSKIAEVKTVVDAHTTTLGTLGTSIGTINSTVNAINTTVGTIVTTVSSTATAVSTINTSMATAAGLAAAISDLQSHGDDDWSTAIGYATPSDITAVPAAVAAVLFVDGPTNMLKVNADHSVNGTGGGGDADPDAIADAVVARLIQPITVQMMGPVIYGREHRLIRGSAYLRSENKAPYTSVLKSAYPSLGLTTPVEYRLLTCTGSRQAKVFSGGIAENLNDSAYWDLFCELLSGDTLTLDVGNGTAQFWAQLMSDPTKFVGISNHELFVIKGIGV